MSTYVDVKPTIPIERPKIMYKTISVKLREGVKKNDKIATVLVDGVEQTLYATEDGSISHINHHYLGKELDTSKYTDIPFIAKIQVNSKIENLEEKKRELSKSGLFHLTDTTATKKGANYTIRDQTMSIDEAYKFLQEYIQNNKRMDLEHEEWKKKKALEDKKPPPSGHYGNNAQGGRTKHRIHQKSKNLRKHKSRKHKSRKNHRKSLRR